MESLNNHSDFFFTLKYYMFVANFIAGFLISHQCYFHNFRFKNYFVAMINKSILPLKFKAPLIGETLFLTRGLKYNIEFLLFWGPWAPFDNRWHLRDEYKIVNQRRQLAKDLSKVIGYIGNILLLYLGNSCQ